MYTLSDFVENWMVHREHRHLYGRDTIDRFFSDLLEIVCPTFQ